MGFVVSSLEYHSIKKGILFTCPTNTILYLRKMLFWMRSSLVRWRTCHNLVQKQCLCARHCSTNHILYLQGNKLAI